MSTEARMLRFRQGPIIEDRFNPIPKTFLGWTSMVSFGIGGCSVEHLAALRARTHLAVYRPDDSVETAECWELVLEQTTTGGASCAVTSTDAAAAEGCQFGE